MMIIGTGRFLGTKRTRRSMRPKMTGIIGGEDRNGRDREKEQMARMRTYKRGFYLWKKTPELLGL